MLVPRPIVEVCPKWCAIGRVTKYDTILATVHTGGDTCNVNGACVIRSHCKSEVQVVSCKSIRPQRGTSVRIRNCRKTKASTDIHVSVLRCRHREGPVNLAGTVVSSGPQHCSCTAASYCRVVLVIPI